MAIITRTNSNFNSLITFLANRMIFGIIAEVTEFLMGAWTILLIDNSFWTISVIIKFSLKSSMFGLAFSSFMLVTTRAWGHFNLGIASLTNSNMISILAKLFNIFESYAIKLSALRSKANVFKLLFLLNSPCRINCLNMLIGTFMVIRARAGMSRIRSISARSINCVISAIISKLFSLTIRTRAHLH